jgi:hypothetical protein
MVGGSNFQMKSSMVSRRHGGRQRSKHVCTQSLNLPRDSKGLTSDECPLADACVLTAILYDFKILRTKEQTDASKLVALKSLGHWVGDMHQPLHVSFLDDKGGNTIRTSGQCPGNFHAVWDTCFVQYAVGPDASEAVPDLLAVITPEMKAEWNAAAPRDLGQRILCDHGGRPNDVLCHARVVMRLDERRPEHQRGIS